MIKNPTPKVSATFGAPMGRHTGPISEGLGDKWALRRIRINNGGYDAGGAYWGAGRPLFWAYNEATTEETFFRAVNRNAAKAHIRQEYDNRARFYR